MVELISYPETSRSTIDRREAQEVGRIFLFANFSGAVNEAIEAALVTIQKQVAAELRSQGFTVSEVPPELELAEAIIWINRRSSPGDVAFSIQTDAFSNPDVRGTAAFYIAGNEERRQQAEQLIQQLLVNVPSLVSRGARPDTETAFGSLAFTRQVPIPSIVLTVGFETSPLDRAIILERPQAIAQGIANGLALLSRNASDDSTPRPYPPININLNGQIYGEQGIIVNGNAYVPVDLLDRLRVDITRPRNVRLVTYGNVTYARAIDLQEVGVFVGWNPTNRTVVLRTIQPFDPNAISSIIGRGYLQEETLEAFLRQVNPQALERFPDIVDLYLEEAAIEGVNPDIAFAQALLETNFFRFGGSIQPSQNNFGALGSVGGEAASFPNARIGVRAHIQLLKTYASLEPIVQEIVAPRFRFIARGIAPRVEQLSGRYSADPVYGERILAILRQLYQFAGLL
ncbi:hormogonium tapered terminus morphoprotein TftA [Leptolyngbya sp. AN03gr2]